MTHSLAYLAGIFDAGASFQIRTRTQRGHSFAAVRLSVGMPNRAAAALFQAHFGGALEFAGKADRRSGKLCWYAREDIAAILAALAPYATHPKLEPMRAFLEGEGDAEIVMRREDPWAT